MADPNAPPLPEVSALQSHACPACGAEAVWTPAQHALVCPYCGTVSPAELAADGSTIIEHDLVTALRSIPTDKRGPEIGRVSVQCQNCKAISVFDQSRVAQRCDFCGSPAIVPYDAMRAAIHPESVLPFRVSESQVREQMRKWYGSRWFAPNRLKSAALTDTVHGVYIPYWTFDAQVAAQWSADAGYYYYETVRRNGKTEQVQRVRWEPASGALSHFFDDELVAATRGVNAGLLRKVEPFPTDSLKPYDTGYVSGWVVEQYQIDLVAAAQAARMQMDGKMRGLCANEVPGDTQRNLEIQSDYSGQTFKHILVPIWLLGYTYGSSTYQVVMNGVTSKIAGKYPFSAVKIVLAILTALIVLLIWSMLDSK